MDLDAHYVVKGPDDIKFGEIVKRRFYGQGVNEPQGDLTEDGLADLDGKLVARWTGDMLLLLDPQAVLTLELQD